MLLDSTAIVIGIDMNESSISNNSYKHYKTDVRDENQIAKIMIPNNRGKIVNISCIRSEIFKKNITDYAASKGAVSSMTSAMALDLASFDIPEDRKASDYVTGTVIFADGGYHIQK